MELFQTQPDRNLRAKALAKEYGIGGHSHSYLDGRSGFITYNSSGMEFSLHSAREPFKLKWAAIEQYIDLMIQSGRYLTDEEREQHTAAQEATIYKVGDEVVVDLSTRTIEGTIGYVGETDVRILTDEEREQHTAAQEATIYKVGDEVVVDLSTRTIEGTIGYVGETDVRIDTSAHGHSWDNEVINKQQFDGDEVVVDLSTRTIEGTIGYVGETDVRIDTSAHGHSWDNEVINKQQFEDALVILGTMRSSTNSSSRMHCGRRSRTSRSCRMKNWTSCPSLL